MNDINNQMIIQLGPEEIKQLLHQQIGFFKQKERRDPNCCMLGLAIITVLDNAKAFERDNKTNSNYFEGLKLYLDGDNECAINVGYSPFITKQGLII